MGRPSKNMAQTGDVFEVRQIGLAPRLSPADRWQCTLDNIESLIGVMRADCEGLTSEERVTLDDCSRRMAELGRMVNSRLRAKALGIEPCPKCGGDAMACIESGVDVCRPYIECQVCGMRLNAPDLGVTDMSIPSARFIKVEEAMAKAWNAQGGARVEEDRDQGR